MRQLAEAVTERSGLTIMLEIAKDSDELPAAVEQSIYRITEEALNNVVRHAQANYVTINLHHNGPQFDLTIIDDGIGFQPETVSDNGHYGLIGMKERATLCHGQLHIKSIPGTGTTVRLTVEKAL